MPLHVTEYANVAFLPNAVGMIPQEPPNADYVVAYGNQSPAFQLGTRFVRIEASGICCVLFGRTTDNGGSGPGAVISTNNARMIDGQTEYRGVPEGGSMQVAAISST